VKMDAFLDKIEVSALGLVHVFTCEVLASASMCFEHAVFVDSRL